MARQLALLPTVLLLCLPAFAFQAAPADSGASLRSVGLDLEALSRDDLDDIEGEIGVRAGVRVKAVTQGSAAARAGLRKGDILLFVSEKPMPSPAAVGRAIEGKSGSLQVVGVRPAGDDEDDDEADMEPLLLNLELPPEGAAAGAGPAKGTAGRSAPAAPAKAEDPRAKLEALETARDAGLLSEEEYERKKSEIEAPRPPTQEAEPSLDEASRKKLEALETAHSAGILSAEEYERKKGELLAKVGGARHPILDEATKRKIAALEAAHEAGILSDDELARKKAEILGGTAATAAADGSQAGASGAGGSAAAGSDEASKGNTYRHPVGFTFWYPDGWKTADQPDFLQLIPRDAGTSPEGPTEIYGISGESVAGQGIRSAEDPRVIDHFDGQVRQFLPNLQRKAAPTKVDTAKGKGILLRYDGTSPKGDPVVALTYAAVIGDFGVGLVALGFKKQVEAREPDLRKIFASFGMGESKRDPRLAGSWTHEKHYTSGTFSSTTIVRMTLESSGKFVRSSNLYASMEHKDSTGASTGSTHVDGGPAPGDRGQWAAADAKLYLLYDDGSYAEYGYEFQPGNMLLKPKDGKAQLWTGGK